jgi:pyruvate/2-oxoglutarate dehydrogenase complex dihydrolipoamide acyltransferase (E2) component
VVETDKAAVEVPAEVAGTLLKILVPAGETVPVSALVAWIGAPGEAIPASEGIYPSETAASRGVAATASPPQRTPAVSRGPGKVTASPIAKRLARELGVDLADVQAYVGPRRVREADVRAFADAREAATPPAPAGDGQAEFDLLEPTPLRHTMASHLSQAAAIPQSAAACQVDLTNLKALRSELLADWEAAYGWRLSYTHILAALVARAVGSCPTLNASWTEEGIRLYRTVNLGVAMTSNRGLVVPVVRNAGQRKLAETAAEIDRLRRAVDRNRLLPADLQGGTFTLTNVGMLGISLSIPLLNPPQSGILGIGAEEARVVLEDNRLWSIPVAWITVVTDHRVVDGAAAAAFLQQTKNLIEDPSAVLR